MREHPQAQARTSEEEVDRRTAEEEPDRNIPVQVVDSRRREVEEYSKSWATGTYALSAASGRNNRT